MWTRRDDAALTVERGPARPPSPVPGPPPPLRVSDVALDALMTPRPAEPARLAHVVVEGERWPVPVGDAGAATGGNVIAGAAWWLAGVQEAATETRDRHGRVPYGASLQSALGDAPGGPLRPAVDAYRTWLADALRQRGVDVPGRTWGGHPWAVALSHDLDAVRTRRVRAGLGSLRLGRPAEAVRRAFGPDRRRASIDELRALAQTHGAAATWFVKPGAWAPEDVPGGLDPALVARLSADVGGGHEVGWHPGYGTLGRPDRLAAEAERFEAAFGHAPALARTHFLRWAEPETPRALQKHGVRIDSTLGWAERPGFRRATAQPFPLYDLGADRPTDLWEMPLAVMDTTLSDHLGLDADGTTDALRRTFDAARQSGGVAVVLWHNQVGGDTAAWTARLDALDRELGHARAAGARVGPLGSLLAGFLGGPA